MTIKDNAPLSRDVRIALEEVPTISKSGVESNLYRAMCITLSPLLKINAYIEAKEDAEPVLGATNPEGIIAEEHLTPVVPGAATGTRRSFKATALTEFQNAIGVIESCVGFLSNPKPAKVEVATIGTFKGALRTLSLLLSSETEMAKFHKKIIDQTIAALENYQEQSNAPASAAPSATTPAGSAGGETFRSGDKTNWTSIDRSADSPDHRKS